METSTSQPMLDRLANPAEGAHPGGAVRHGRPRQLLRMTTSLLYFFCGVILILTTQVIGCPLYYINRPLYYRYMARTKAHFGVLITTVTQWWSPTVIRVTGDHTVRDQLCMTADGRVECRFPERLVLIANHQLYSDWLYLWWVAYTARMHGYIYIILKESLKYIPFLGLGMQFYGFIFMARKWEQDKPRMQHRLAKLSANHGKNPMWLLIFPEGTNLSNNGRVNSKKFADKQGIPDLKHQLLPRSTGLRFCLEQLQDTVDWVYDCTVAYEGIRRGEYGQDYFTLYSTCIEGRPPKSVNLHWRRFPISSVPVNDAKEFDAWLRARWAEKDELLEYYMQHNRFPEDEVAELASIVDDKFNLRKRVNYSQNGNGSAGTIKKWSGPIETEVRLAGYLEILDCFVVVVVTFITYKVASAAFNLLHS